MKAKVLTHKNTNPVIELPIKCHVHISIADIYDFFEIFLSSRSNRTENLNLFIL